MIKSIGINYLNFKNSCDRQIAASNFRKNYLKNTARHPGRHNFAATP
jgi:hypothetical protein